MAGRAAAIPRSRAAWGIALTAVFMLLISSVLVPSGSEAHAPYFPEENDSIASAYEIDDIAKSYVLYSFLPEESGHYYTFELEEGERLLLQILVPVKDAEEGFIPDVALMIPGGGDGGGLPAYVEVPPTHGHKVINGSLPAEVDYEGFTATAYYVTIDFDETSDGFANESGTFYIAVFHPGGEEGAYALVVGYQERFTALEWLTMPLSQLNIFDWQGTGLLPLLLPLALTFAIGLAATARRLTALGPVEGAPRALVLVGGLSFIATAAVTATHMAMALSVSGLSGSAAITLVLILISLALGSYTVLLSLDLLPGARPTRARLLALALLALVSWNGYIIGPALLLTSALWPRSGD